MANIPHLVAFAGYAGAGKDVAAIAMIERGYASHQLGDFIKRRACEKRISDALAAIWWSVRNESFLPGVPFQISNACRLIVKGIISPWTQDRAEKALIRAYLEKLGEARYDLLLKQMLDALPEHAVNSRLVRCREAKVWKANGGVIIEIRRPGIVACTEWEEDRLAELRRAGYIDAVIVNDGTPAELGEKILKAVYSTLA